MKKEMEYYAKSRYDIVPDEGTSWGRPVRIRSQAAVDEWRRVSCTREKIEPRAGCGPFDWLTAGRM